MKKSIATIGLSLMVLVFGMGMVFAGNGKLGRSSDANRGGPQDRLDLMPYEVPSDVEAETLAFMVQEEKLARDVYRVLYNLWRIPAFMNIAEAEQRHMAAVIRLMDKYGIENPVAGLDAGIFADQDLQTFYNNLIDAGQESQEQALLAGATIEDADIFNLRNELQVVDNEDIIMVFENLLQGSMNHLRAFTSLLVMYGYVPYTASDFLTQEEIDEILAAPPVHPKTKYSNKGSTTNHKAHFQHQNRLFDSNGDGICDFLQ